MDIQALRPHAIDSLRTVLMEVEANLNCYKDKPQPEYWDRITTLLDERSIVKAQIDTLCDTRIPNSTVAELVIMAVDMMYRDYDNLAQKQEEDNFYLYG